MQVKCLVEFGPLFLVHRPGMYLQNCYIELGATLAVLLVHTNTEIFRM